MEPLSFCTKILTGLFLLISVISSAQRFDYKVCIPENDTIDRQPVVRFAEIDAAPDGGRNKFFSMISKMLFVTKSNDRYIIDSHADFTFIVDTKGQIRNFCFFRKDLWTLDEAELYENSPTWKPALIDNKAVPQRFIVPMIVELR